MNQIFKNFVHTSKNIFLQACPSSVGERLGLSAMPWQFTQQRGRYVNRWMWRDVKRRNLVKEYTETRVRYNSLKRNSVLPKELQEIASEEMSNLPRDSCRTRVVNRCVLTS